MGELSHTAVRELLGAYALDAVEGDERAAIERHLAECEPCRVEVGEHREVVSFLASSWVPAPEGVWDRIAASLEESPPTMQLGGAVSLGAARQRRRERRAGPVRVAVAGGVAAAVAALGFLGVTVLHTNHRIDTVAQLAEGNVGQVAAAASRRPDARDVTLRSTDGRLTADAVLLPDGTGYLVQSNLPTLTADRSYQLWAVVDDAKISVGVLGTSAGPVAFHTAGPVSALAITDEVSGGVVVTQQAPTVVGAVA